MLNLKMNPFKSELSFFLPGAILLAIGFAMIAAPKLFIYLIAGAVMFFGVLLISLAAKFMILKDRFSRTFSARVVMHPGESVVEGEPSSTVITREDIKKIILH